LVGFFSELIPYNEAKTGQNRENVTICGKS
jgi:hypothetical protein